MNKLIEMNLSDELLTTKIYNPYNDEEILLKSLWENNNRPYLLIHWLRRFGWVLCKMGAQELSSILLEISNEFPESFNFIGIGLSELNFKQFDEENNFKDAKIYLDLKKETYKALGYEVKGASSIKDFFDFKILHMITEIYKKKLSGNLKGDGLQLGGTLIINRKGDVVFSHIQKTFHDYPERKELGEFFKINCRRKKIE